MPIEISKSNRIGANAERLVEKFFADHGWFTFLPMYGQDPPIDLIAVRGNDIRTIQVKSGSLSGKFKNQVRVTLSPGGRPQTYSERLKKWKEHQKVHGSPFNTLAIVFDGRIAVLGDPAIWDQKTGVGLSLHYRPKFVSKKTRYFEEFENPGWVKQDETAMDATKQWIEYEKAEKEEEGCMGPGDGESTLQPGRELEAQTDEQEGQELLMEEDRCFHCESGHGPVPEEG